MKYWLTACSSLLRKKVWLGELTIAVDLGHKATKQTKLVFVGMKIPLYNPFCIVSAIHLDGVHSVCSFMKCPLVITNRRFSSGMKF